MKAYNFCNTKLIDIFLTLKKDILEKDYIEFSVLNPDILNSTYSGNSIVLDNNQYIYRSYKSYMELAQRLNCKFLTPKEIDENRILIRFKKLNKNSSFHKQDDIEQ